MGSAFYYTDNLLSTEKNKYVIDRLDWSLTKQYGLVSTTDQ